MMTNLMEISAKYAAKYGLTEDMLRNAERWTETTGDLEGGVGRAAAGHSGHAVRSDCH